LIEAVFAPFSVPVIVTGVSAEMLEVKTVKVAVVAAAATVTEATTAILGVTREHGRNVMRRLAVETGGAFFEVTKDRPITWIYSQIEEALRNQYSIGYTPERPAAHGRYCRIKLTTNRAGLSVQARDGYYAK
jgi:VWFA-related protein